MRALFDANVLLPTVLREILLAVARAGLYQPLWSARILEEWARAAARQGLEAEARGEIALLRANWPKAELPPAPEIEARLWLPDKDDIHVLASAVAGEAGVLVTENGKDFPRAELSNWGVRRQSADEFLLACLERDPDAVSAAVRGVHAQAQAMAGEEIALRALLKRVRLPRLGKALTRS
jgi:predicted nucleic acid-binding protein